MKLLALCVAATLVAGCSAGPFSFAKARSNAPAPAPSDTIALRHSTELYTPPSAPAALEPDNTIGDGTFRAEQARALDGDKDSALRVAQMFREGSNGVPRDERRMVKWLIHASDLDSGDASYQLYLHYLGRGRDRDAVRYESRALRQGYIPPPRLDPRRG